MVIIPTNPNVPSWVQQTELEGVIYVLEFSWNTRDGAWFLTISTVGGTVVRAGIRLVPNFPLLRKVRHVSRPTGELMVYVDTAEGITRDNLGTDAVLVYVSAAELQGLLGG